MIETVRMWTSGQAAMWTADQVRTSGAGGLSKDFAGSARNRPGGASRDSLMPLRLPRGPHIAVLQVGATLRGVHPPRPFTAGPVGHPWLATAKGPFMVPSSAAR